MFPNGMKLFLVEFEVTADHYMADSMEPEAVNRIVFARDSDEAESKILAQYQNKEYSVYYRVWFRSVSEAVI